MRMTLDQVTAVEQTPLPALSQSKHADMACGLLYVAKNIEGMRLDSPAAARGTEIHNIIADYMEELRISHHPTDYEKFDQLSRDASAEAKEVLQRFCESWFIDSEKIYDTEMFIALDGAFDLIEARGKSKRSDQRKPGIVYEGTLDLVVMESENDATIYDWKSYFQIVNADTFQSKLYPLLLFRFNPGIETVRFVLSFVRYGDAQRDVTYTRDDIPNLMNLARRERRRQEELHARAATGKTERASPGRQCIWCPLMLNGCPMRELNPFVTMTPTDRVKFELWAAAASRENRRLLKEVINLEGPVTYRDSNGTGYEAFFDQTEKRFYSAADAFPLLQAWDEDHNDQLLRKATVGGLSSPLKAKKRAVLAEQMAGICSTRVETKLKVAGADDDESESES